MIETKEWAVLLAVLVVACAAGVDAATPVVFEAASANHYNGFTKTLFGAEAQGDDFRIVLQGDKDVDTAWRMTSNKMPLPAETAFVAFDFEIYTDGDWRPVIWDGPSRDTRIVWSDAVGKSVKAPPWVDALGVEHAAEKLDLQFKPGVYSRFRVVRDVPVGAFVVQLVFGRDTPNLRKGERVSVRDVKVEFIAKGTARPEEIVPDARGPLVRIAFASPTEDESVEVKYTITDRSGIDWESLAVTDMGGKERYTFRRDGDTVTIAPGRRWGKGDHHFQISVNDAIGNETKQAKAFRIGPKPSVPGTTLREDGVLLVGGQPVFPIGLFSLCPREANLYSLTRCFDDLQPAGINLAHSYTHYRVPEFAAGCAKHAMISFQRMYDSAEGSAWFERTARHDPMVGLWYVGDDTCMHYEPAEIANRVETLAALDGTRLSCHADVYTARFGEYADLVDVFMPEIYPIHTERDVPQCVAKTIDIMEKSLADIRNHSSGKVRTVWPIIQYFKGWSSWHRMPTPEEVYAMSFAAIIHGGKGITWYTYGGFIEPEKKRFNYGVCSSAQTWHTTTNLTRRLSALSPVFLARDVKDVRTPEMLSGPERDAFNRPSVTVLLKEHAGATYVFAVNATMEQVSARIFTGLAGASAGTVLYEDRAVKGEAGAFEDTFEPFAVHIYKFDSKP